MVAVIDEAAILLSEIQDLIGLGLVERRPGESDAELIERVVDAVIEQRLRFLAVDRSGFERVPVAEIEARVAEIAAEFPSPEAFQRRLAELGMTAEEVHQIAARQIAEQGSFAGLEGATSFAELNTLFEDSQPPQAASAGAGRL